MSTPRRHRPVLIALVAVVFVLFLVLAWWQWTRFESNGGTFQNLGYALQWPAFAIFVVYAYRRYIQLESEVELDATPAESEFDPSIIPARPASTAETDDTTSAYNQYLADLAATERNEQEPR